MLISDLPSVFYQVATIIPYLVHVHFVHSTSYYSSSDESAVGGSDESTAGSSSSAAGGRGRCAPSSSEESGSSRGAGLGFLAGALARGFLCDAGPRLRFAAAGTAFCLFAGTAAGTARGFGSGADPSAGTLAIAAAPAPHFVCAVQSALDRTSCRPNFMLALKTTYVALSRHNLP